MAAVVYERLRARLFPFMSWARAAMRKDVVRADAAAGLVSAALTLPQAIVFAALVGVPPQYGLYTAIFATLIAALWGSSRHLLTGPNTAMSLMLGATAASFAAVGSHEYLALIAVVTLSVGITQVLIGLTGLSRYLTTIPLAALDAFMAAVGVQILLSQIPYAGGITPVAVESTWKGAVSAVLAAGDFHPASLLVFGVTLLTGVLLRTFAPKTIRRFALPAALLAGLVTNEFMVWISPATRFRVFVAGHAVIRLLPFDTPRILDPLYRAALLHGIPAVLAIAAVGLIQSLLVSRAAAEESGQPVDIDQDAIAQGVANVAVSFLSGFAAGGSVNRSKAHQDAGARTPMAAVYSALFILLAALVLPGVIAAIPVPAMAAMLCLVGASLIHPREIVALAKHSGGQAALYAAVLFCGVFVGLTAAVVIGFAIPAVYYMAQAAEPRVVVAETADGLVASLTGAVFFVSVQAIARQLRILGESCGWAKPLTLDLQGVHYLDHDGRVMLSREIDRWRAHGSHVCLKADFQLEPGI